MIRAVIFDLDGTIVEAPYDWPEIKRRLETGGTPILTYLDALPEPEKSVKRSFLESYEEKATQLAILKEGVGELLDELRAKGVRTALVTNNSSRNVVRLLRKFSLHFDCVITRDSGRWKPSGAPLGAALDILGVRPEDACAVGDSLIDVQSALEAGVSIIYLLGDRPVPGHESRVVRVESVDALRRRLRSRGGKLEKTFEKS